MPPVNLVSIISLIVGVIGGALGAFSILVTWKLYQAGSKINIEAMNALGQIKTSSHTAEVTATRYTERLVDALIEQLNQVFQANLTVGRASVVERVNAALTSELRDTNPAVTARVREKVYSELSSAFHVIQSQTASLPRLPNPEITRATSVTEQPKALLVPGVPRLVRWIVENEGKFRFFSVKFLREKVFKSDPAVQEALQFAIDQGILETYELKNPANPSWPTTACRLNRSHPVIRDILGETGNNKRT